MLRLRRVPASRCTKTGRSSFERPAFLHAAPALLVVALASCSASVLALSGPHRPPGVVPALSLAGLEGAGCMHGRDPKLWGQGFEVADPVGLETEPDRIARAVETGGVGHPAVHYFRCHRFEVELAVLLESPGTPPAGDSRRAGEMLTVLLTGAPARSALWTLADSMRISPGEPFVYGSSVSLSDDESLSVRFGPTRSDVRVMVVYRFEL